MLGEQRDEQYDDANDGRSSGFASAEEELSDFYNQLNEDGGWDDE